MLNPLLGCLFCWESEKAKEGHESAKFWDGLSDYRALPNRRFVLCFGNSNVTIKVEAAQNEAWLKALQLAASRAGENTDDDPLASGGLVPLALVASATSKHDRTYSLTPPSSLWPATGNEDFERQSEQNIRDTFSQEYIANESKLRPKKIIVRNSFDMDDATSKCESIPELSLNSRAWNKSKTSAHARLWQKFESGLQ
jgi:hypothetical protein